MKVLITGSNGLLGSDLVKELGRHHEVFGLGLGENQAPGISFETADIADEVRVREIVRRIHPDAIIHAAAYSDADGCEQNPEQALLINFKGTQWMAEAGDSVGAKFFFISSDYVFDGNKKGPYQEDDAPNPKSVYGRSKANAEEFLKNNCKSAWVIRTSWLFGQRGKSFFRSILNAVLRGDPIRVVNDQRGAPTYTRDLAYALRIMIEKSKPDTGCHIYHLANAGAVSRFEAAKSLLAKINYQGTIVPVTSEESRSNWPAPRPQNSVLSTKRVEKDFGIKFRSWESAMNEFWDEVLEKEWEEKSRANPL